MAPVVKPPRARASGQSVPPERFKINLRVAFLVFGAVNVAAALTAPIADCDETYNYWEPTHYLSHGYGLQTWEYSPEFAIRSWTYIALHAMIGRLGYLFTFSKTFEFYWIRCVLALVCASCETVMFSAVSKALNPRVGIMFMAILVSAPGMFSASAAYLPSSFAMYMNMLGAATFIDWQRRDRTTSGIRWFGIGGIIGWPFAAALALPFLLEDVAMTWITEEWAELLRAGLLGCIHLVFIAVIQIFVEAFFYHKAALVPWNIVSYNVFSGSGRGPDIFGTEPADFYLRNLLLNFNVWAILALVAGPILVLQFLFRRHTLTRGAFRSMVMISPFYMWLAIFSMQSHKEERFMYPAYPFLALNAAMALHNLLGWLGNTNPRTLVGRIPTQMKLIAIIGGLLVALGLGMLRTVGIVSAYRAPLRIYSDLITSPGVGKHTTVCLGKEWYRFPSSYFLPNDIHVRFVKSEFRGLLPGQFSEANTGFGLFPGTWLVPEGMNDQNKEDPNKYIRLAQCDYLVDSLLPSQHPTALEPAHVNNTRAWKVVHCEPFLDAGTTHLLGRLFWLPRISLVPERFRRQWGQYCLLQRRTDGGR